MKRHLFRRSVLPVSVLVLLGALVGCATPAPPDDMDRSLTIAVNPADLNVIWDPAAGALIYALPTSQPIYEPLIARNVETLGYDPVLASEYTLSDDRRTMSITLRDDVDFTDGVHLDAEAVKANLDWVMEKGLHFSVGEMTRLEPEFVVTGEYELEIRASSGIADRFLNALTYLGIVSPEALDSPDYVDVPPPGTGPYVLDEAVPEVSTTYVRNPEYRDPGAFDFDTVTFVGFTDVIAAANALKSGQVDAAKLDVSLLADVERSGFTVSTGAGYIFTLIWLDRPGEIQPALADKRIRQAISQALDRDAINESLNLGYGVVSSQAFLEGTAEYVEGGDDRYPYDLDAARDLMAEAGYADGFDITIPTYPAIQPYAPIVAQSLGEIGIRVTWEELPDAAAAIKAFSSLAYPLILFRMVDAFWVSYISEGGYFNGFGAVPADPEVAALVTERDNGSPDDSAAAAQELGAFLLDEAWYIPFARVPDVWASIDGISVDPGRLGGWPMQLSNFTLSE